MYLHLKNYYNMSLKISDLAALNTVTVGATGFTPKLLVEGSNSSGLAEIYVSAGSGNALRLNTNFVNGNYIDINPYINGVSNGGFSISQNGAPRFVITAGGNAGIGTAADAGYKLDVNGTERVSGKLTIAADAGNEQVLIQRASNTNAQLIIGYHSDGYGRIQAVEQNVGYRALVLNQSGGNVGIGTTEPRQRLDVEAYTSFMSLSSGINSEATTPDQQIGGIDFRKHYALAIGASMRLLQSGGVNNYSPGHLAFYTNDGSTAFNTVPPERLRIASSGNVLINTQTDAGYKLDVNGPGRFSGKVTASDLITYGIYGPDKSNIDALNTKTDGTAGFISLVGHSGNTSSPYRWGGISGGKSTAVGDGQYGGYLSFWTTSGGENGQVASASYERMRINSAGDVSMSDITSVSSRSLGIPLNNAGWVKLCTIHDNSVIKIIGKVNSNNSEETFTIDINTTYYANQSLISVTRKTYNPLLAEVRVAGTSDGIDKFVYVRFRTNENAPTVNWHVIDSKGVVAINNTLTTPTEGIFNTLTVTGNNIYCTNADSLQSGAATFLSSVTATGFFNSSDIRLKEIVPYEYSVSDIKPISYLWKDLRDNKKHIGYSAQDVQKVMPDAVNEGEDGMLSVNYVEVLVAKIAELENRIKQLEK